MGAGDADLRGWERVGVLPFDHERRMVSATVRGPDGTAWIITKGAPEVLLTRCRDVPGELAERVDAEFAQGSRVVAVATKRIPRADTAPTREDERDLEAVGLLVFRDPPKPDARASLERLADLGISIKVVTGDNPVVALKVCSDLGLPAAAAVTGPQLANMSDAELERAVQETTVFARVSPEDKARIVRPDGGLSEGWRFWGRVNDALALHSADIGVSVDTATDVAKDAADVIMLEKDLDVLAGGVTEGRRIFANTIKYVMMGTSSNFGNMFSAAGASVFLPFLPMLPSQILLNNLLYDSGQLAIPTDRVDAEQLRKPSHWDIAFIRLFMVIFGPLSSVFDFLTFGLLLWVFGAGECSSDRMVRGVAGHPGDGDLRHPHPDDPVLPEPPEHADRLVDSRCCGGRGRPPADAAGADAALLGDAVAPLPGDRGAGGGVPGSGRVREVVLLPDETHGQAVGATPGVEAFGAPPCPPRALVPRWVAGWGVGWLAGWGVRCRQPGLAGVPLSRNRLTRNSLPGLQLPKQFEQLQHHLGLGQRVAATASVHPHGDQTGLTQHREVFRHRRLAHARVVGHVADVALAAEQTRQQLPSNRMGERTADGGGAVLGHGSSFMYSSADSAAIVPSETEVVIWR